MQRKFRTASANSRHVSVFSDESRVVQPTHSLTVVQDATVSVFSDESRVVQQARRVGGPPADAVSVFSDESRVVQPLGNYFTPVLQNGFSIL